MSGFSKGYIRLFVVYIRNARGILQRKFIMPIIEASKSVGYRETFLCFYRVRAFWIHFTDILGC